MKLNIGRWRGLPLQIFALIVLPLTLLIFAIAFGSLALHQRAMRTMVGERDERAARAAAAAIMEQLNHRAAAVGTLALQASTSHSPEHALNDTISFLPDFDGGLALYAADGSFLAATNDPALWQARSLELQSEKNDSVSGTLEFLPPFTDPTTQRLMMLVVVTAPNGLTAVGAFSPSNLVAYALSNLFGSEGETAAFVITESGQVINQIGTLPRSFSELTQHPGVMEALRGESGTTYLDVDDKEHVIAFSPIAPVNWALVIEEPWQSVADPLLAATEVAPLVLVPALIIALVAIWFGVRQIVHPLQSLEQKATELGAGDFAAIEEPVGGIEEIRHLQTELIHMAQKVQAAQQNLRDYLEVVTTSQEEERQRLARDLHDDTIQSLIALNQRVQLAQLAINGRPAIAQLAEMQQMISQIIANLRRLSRDLRPIYLEDLGLIPAVDMLVRDTGAVLGIPIQFHSTGVERRLTPSVELALYRIVQEALNNVVRHAQATSAEVQLSFTPQVVTLMVQDDGRGFTVPDSPSEMAPRGHFGLLGMHERAELIGAHLVIQSAPSKGTCLVITLPSPDKGSTGRFVPPTKLLKETALE